MGRFWMGLLATALFLFCAPPVLDAIDPLDPEGNIIIKWDVRSWTGDGYVALVNMYNFQLFRHIDAPGWTLGWHWASQEFIWSMVGAQATMQGDCSRIMTTVLPHSCKPDPQIVDLLPGVPYNSRVGGCCRGGLMSSFLQDPANSVSSFQITVGGSGNTNTTILLPKNFTLLGPGPGYTCGPAVKVKPTLYPNSDGRRFEQALMTWNITCVYSQRLAQKAPTCCVSFSAFYNDTIIPCPTCTCACQANITSPTAPSTCVDPMNKKAVAAVLKSGTESQGIYCTSDMCPVKVHWHIKSNYKQYWRAKITVTNRNLFKNYTQWNVAAQHPNFDNFTRAFSFSYRGISPFGDINNTAVFFGLTDYNEMLTSAGPDGNVQSEILFQKDPGEFTLRQGWAFPRRIYFNGDDCVLPDPDDYPRLPSSAPRLSVKASSSFLAFMYFLTILALCC